MSALALGLIAAFAWALHDIVVRQVSQRIPLMAALLAVLCIALLFHGAAMVWAQESPLVAAEVLLPSVLAGVFFLIASIGLYHAFERGPVRLVAPIIASFPILSVLWASVSGVPVSALQWLAVLAIVAGVSTVAALSEPDAEDIPPRGPTALYAGIAALGFAGTFALGQHAAEMAGEMPTVLISRVVAVVLLVAFIAARGVPFWPGRGALPWLVLMGLCDAVALICVNAAGTMPDAQYAAVAASMFGMLTVIMAWAFLKERMRPGQWFGCAVAFGAIGYLAL